MDKYELARANMVSNQLMTDHVRDKNILDAMATIPRHEFVDATWRDVAYFDGNIPLGHGRYMMQPNVFARMVQALGLNHNSKVLEIGCGTGYSTAVLAKIAGEVVAIESTSDFVNRAINILHKLGIKNASVMHGELLRGAPEQAPFDAILISGKINALPQSLTCQLGAEGGCVYIKHYKKALSRAVMYLRHDDPADGIDLFDASNTEPLQ